MRHKQEFDKFKELFVSMDVFWNKYEKKDIYLWRSYLLKLRKTFFLPPPPSGTPLTIMCEKLITVEGHMSDNKEIEFFALLPGRPWQKYIFEFLLINMEPYSKCPFSINQCQQRIQIMGYHISVDTVIRDNF